MKDIILTNEQRLHLIQLLKEDLDLDEKGRKKLTIARKETKNDRHKRKR